jgi:uncharacterized protein YfaS (alpha-2-macroglobulin family)
MGFLKSFAITLVVAFFLSSCKQDSVTLESTTARGEVPQLGNLTFRFSNALMPDSLLNDWDSTEYISFKPAIAGRFRWQSPDELVFSPSKPLLPSTTYKAEVRDEVLRYSKYDRVKSDKETQFHTAPLQFDAAQVTWVLVDEGSRAITPQLQLGFNYAVKTDLIKEKLSVLIDGAATPFTIQNVGSSKMVNLRLNNLKAVDKSYEAVVKLEKGLVPEGGKNSSEAIETTLSIPSPFVLNINSVEAEHDGTEGIVRIYTSQQPAQQNLTSLLQFHPSIKYSVAYDDYGITVRSDAFDADEAYTFSIAKGLRGVIGGTLREEYNGSAAFGDLEAGISFTNSKAVYLSKSGGGNIEVHITNVPKVKLIISKIYENNLLMAQRSGYYPADPENEEARYALYEDDGNEYSEATAGDIIYTKELDTRSLPKSGGGYILNVSQFEDLLPDTKGIYHVSLRSVKEYWIGDSRFISRSDIGLIAKRGRDKLFVFANSIKTASALNGVSINVYGANNQLLGTGATNTDGVAEIAVAKQAFAGFTPAMVIAKTGDDFTYLPFNNTKVNTSRFDVGGKRANATGLDAFIYAERDIYRPGETVHYSVLLRDVAWKSPGEIPIKIKFLLPNGKEAKTVRKGLNEGGATEGNMEIAPAAITGSYMMEVYTSNDVLLASKAFMIEEFMPDRIRLNTKLSKPVLQPSDAVQLDINAKNFFGPPAANRKWETEIQVRAKAFSAPQFRDYDFGLTNGQTLFEKTVQEGKTDEEGNAVVDYPVPQLYKNTGLLQAAFYTTVFDETGRPVSKYTTADIFTQPIFYGIRDDGWYYHPLNQPVQFTLAAADKAGKPAAGNANVQIIKREYKTVLSKSGSYFRYDSQKEDKVIESKNAAFTGRGSYTFIPRSPGDYEIRIYHPGATAYVSKAFYSYGSWGGDASSFEVNTEGEIDMELDKKKYTTGDKAKILFKTPFSGRMLVTTERDGVLSHQYVDVTKRSASLDIPLDERHVPNVYVTATIFKPHALSDIPLTVAHGFKNIDVESPGRKIIPQITAQKTVRSRTHQKVSVKAVPGSYVTLAAVDNGVLQVSDFKTPDPYGYFYQKKALGVQAYDMYPLLFAEVRARRSSTGGDGDLELQKRINPMPAKRVKILSYWSGIRKTGGNGVAEFEFDVPQFSGELRLMAVAYKEDKFGSSEATITVADPVVLSAALPRFLSPGDTALLPITITNTTARAATGQAALKADGPFKIIGTPSQAISLNANSETTALFQVVAAPAIGVGKITVTVNALGERFTDETEISVRPPSTLQKVTGSGSIIGGKTERLQIPSNNFIAGTTNYELIVSRSPVAELSNHLRYLVQYPYGCTEQVVSGAFPQLYYGDFAEKTAWGSEKVRSANTNVQDAIRKIRMRQLYNGAVTLWDGEGTEDWWTTVYAAHFLLEAKKAGYDVDDSLLETMLSYIASRLRTKNTITYYYNRDQQRKIAPKEVPYSLYVLALANRAQASSMNYYKASPQLLALDGRYLLSAAYAIAGDRRQAAQFLPASFSGEVSVKQTGGSFYTPVRDEAIALNALLDADPGNAQIPVMAQHISDRLKQEPYLNTQERAFSFLALGKLARATAASSVTAEIRSGGKVIGKIDGSDWQSRKSMLQAGPVEIVTKGNGRLYYFWQAEGISNDGSYREEDNYLKVRRTFYDRYGRVMTNNTFKQNDLIVVGISLEKSFNTTIENIVITDLLPAGFEIENPRTKELPGMEWIKNASEPTALDVRDDRIHFFVNATQPKQTYYYAVRTVSLGHFKQGPVSADAMYNGEYHSYHGAGTVNVAR